MPGKVVKYPGVRRRTRKNRGVDDVYFSIFYPVDKLDKDGNPVLDQDGNVVRKPKEEGLGWASSGWTGKKAFKEREKLMDAAKRATGEPVTLEAKRNLKRKKDTEAREKAEAEQKKLITFADFWEKHYWPDRQKSGRSPETIRKEKEHFNNWLNPAIGHLPLKNIVKLNVQKVQHNLTKAGRSPRTVQFVFNTFRQCWEYARDMGIVTTKSPTKDKAFKYVSRFDNQRIRFLSYTEAEELLTRLKSRSIITYQLALLSLDTGMRAGEMFKLQWQNVDLDRGTIAIHSSTTKSKKTRHVRMTARVKAMLTEIGKGKYGQLVFMDEDGNQLEKISNTFPKTVDDMKLNEGIDKKDRANRIVFHSLRHTHASWHAMNGTSMRTLQELLGHSSLVMTQRYSHLSPEHLEVASVNFENALNQKVVELRSKENANS